MIPQDKAFELVGRTEGVIDALYELQLALLDTAENGMPFTAGEALLALVAQNRLAALILELQA